MQAYKCDHIHLKATDVDAAVQWYVEKLGAQITFETQFKGSKVKYMKWDDFTIICFGQLDEETGDAEPIGPTLRIRFGVDHFGFAVDEVRAAIEELRSGGVTILEEPWSPRDGLTIAYIEGPDKVRIELTQRD